MNMNYIQYMLQGTKASYVESKQPDSNNIESSKLLPHDYYTLASIAGDLAALGLSFTGLSPAAAATGMASTTALLIGDVKRDGFLLKDLGWAALGYGLDALSLIPAAGAVGQTAKVAPKLAKAAPIILGLGSTAIASLGIGTSIPAFKKVVNGEKLTVDDYRLMANALMAVVGIGRQGKGLYDAKKAKTGPDAVKLLSEDELSSLKHSTDMPNSDRKLYASDPTDASDMFQKWKQLYPNMQIKEYDRPLYAKVLFDNKLVEVYVMGEAMPNDLDIATARLLRQRTKNFEPTIYKSNGPDALNSELAYTTIEPSYLIVPTDNTFASVGGFYNAASKLPFIVVRNDDYRVNNTGDNSTVLHEGIMHRTDNIANRGLKKRIDYEKNPAYLSYIYEKWGLGKRIKGLNYLDAFKHNGSDKWYEIRATNGEIVRNLLSKAAEYYGKTPLEIASNPKLFDDYVDIYMNSLSSKRSALSRLFLETGTGYATDYDNLLWSLLFNDNATNKYTSNWLKMIKLLPSYALLFGASLGEDNKLKHKNKESN